MKKFISAFLIASLALSFCMPCFAEETAAEKISSFKLAKGEALYFLRADNFKEDLGRWAIIDATSGSVLPVLQGVQVPEGSDLSPANTTIEIKESGTYYIHTLSLDYAENQPATRHFTIAINDVEMPNKAGTHKEEGWRWQLLGEAYIEAGETKVSVVDTSNFFGRCQGIAITTDKDFVGPSDDEILEVANIYAVGEEFKLNVFTPSNKLGQSVMLYLGSSDAYVLGEKAKIDSDNETVVPFTENDRTLVPVRFIAESFGATVSWDDATQTVTVNVDNKEIKMVLGKAEMTVNGKTVALDTPANTYNDRTFIPLRAMAEAINKKVFWDDRGLIVISNLTLDATADKDLIEKAVAGFNGEEIDFSVIKEDLSSFVGTIGEVDYRMSYFNENELRERNGISNTINKLKNGETVSVAYLGGSITEQNGWRGKSLEWLTSQYPDADIKEINLTLGGTGADLAVCRAENELLPLNADLVFFEYAVNGGTSENAEGMIRKIWKSNPKTDICFVYTTRTGHLRHYQNGIASEYEQGYEVVAEYYGVPSISFGFMLSDLNDQGLLTLEGSEAKEGTILFSPEGTHPTMEGSILYAGAVARGIATMDKHARKDEVIHELKEPMFEYNWENATALDYSVAEFSGEWTELTHNGVDYGEDFFPYQGSTVTGQGKMFPKVIGTRTPGSSFTVKFTGTTIGILDLGGPYSGQLKVSVDGGEEFTISRHTPNNGHLRYQYAFIPEVPYGEHTAVFTLDSTIINKSQLSDYEERKAEYNKAEFYLGRILLQDNK